VSSEHQRIERIRQLFQRPSRHVVLGIGDDCAVLAPSALPQVWTVDTAVENVHFSRSFMSCRQIAYRAFMAAASDIAAMGGRATAALSSLSLPRAFSDAELDDLLAGTVAAADLLRVVVAGGNLARASELSLCTSVFGECPAKVLRRDSASVGDGVFVTGTLGGASLGLSALQAGEPEDGPYAASIARFLRPLARLDVADSVARVASSAIDVSDGLIQDLLHVCNSSRVGATLRSESLPRLPDFDALARQRGHEPNALLLGGGEDYELLFTAPLASVPAELATCIGVVEAQPGLRVLDASGAPLPDVAGFDHFR